MGRSIGAPVLAKGERALLYIYMCMRRAEMNEMRDDKTTTSLQREAMQEARCATASTQTTAKQNWVGLSACAARSAMGSRAACASSRRAVAPSRRRRPTGLAARRAAAGVARVREEVPEVPAALDPLRAKINEMMWANARAADKLTPEQEAEVAGREAEYEALVARLRGVLFEGATAPDDSIEEAIFTAPGQALPWQLQYALLEAYGLEARTAAEACEEAEANERLLVDVREADVFAKAHAVEAVNVPLFVPSTKTDGASRAKGAVLTVLGLGNRNTDRNPEFIDDVLLSAEGCCGETPITLLCDTGGTLEPLPGVAARRFGIESRSLRAAFELIRNGFTDVSFVESGYSGWLAASLPTTSSADE